MKYSTPRPTVSKTVFDETINFVFPSIVFKVSETDKLPPDALIEEWIRTFEETE